MTWTELLPHLMLAIGVLTLCYQFYSLVVTSLTVIARSINDIGWSVNFNSNIFWTFVGIILIIYSQSI